MEMNLHFDGLDQNILNLTAPHPKIFGFERHTSETSCICLSHIPNLLHSIGHRPSGPCTHPSH